MKRVRKLAKYAGASLMAGITLTGAAAAANLGDYPNQFIDDEGNVNAQIVVGESAKTVDVVGAVNIAGSLGQDAVKTTTKTVSAESGVSSWSASGGVTLDTSNDNLFFMDNLDSVRNTLTSQQMDALADTTFRDDSGDETDIENYLYPGSKQVQFGKPDDRSNKDPILYVDNPANPSSTDHLFQLQANFEDSIDFTANDVQDEEIQLFGNTYTVSTDTTATELILFGSQEETSIDSGSSKTVTINGNEHTFEVVAVTSSNTTAFRVDGNLKEKDEEDTFTVDGKEVRVSDVIQTSTDNSQGTVTFGVGTEELTLQDGQAIEDGDGNDIDGTYVEFQGTDSGDSDSGVVNELEGLDVYVGAQNDDHEYVQAGNSYSHPMFEDFTFRFGGLNPDAGQGASDSVGEISVSPTGDDTVKADFSAGGSSASVEFLHETSTGDSNTNLALADDDGDKIVAVEGDAVQEDEYVMTDAGDFSHLWEVTNVDVDTTDLTANGASGDEATVTLKDVVSGDSVELDLDAGGDGNSATNDDVYEGEEVIDGQTYHATLDTKDTSSNSDDDLVLTWGTDADFGATGSGSSGATTAFPTIETDNGARLAFYDPAQDPSDFGTTLYAFSSSERYTDADGSTSYDDGEAIINSGDTTLSSGEIVTAGSADLTSFGSSLYNADSDANDNNAYNDGEVIVNDQGDSVFTAGGLGSSSGDEVVKAGTAALKEDTGTTGDASGQLRYYDEDTGGSWDQTGGAEDPIYFDADDDNTYDSADVLVYDPSGLAPATGTTTSNFGDTDNIMYHDADHDGVYDATAGGAAEPIFLTSTDTAPNGDLTSSDTVISVTGTNSEASSQSVDLTGMSGQSIRFAEDGSAGYDGTEAIVDAATNAATLESGEVVTSGTASITQFATGIEHDNSDGDGTTGYEDGDNIVDDADSSGTYSSGDTVITGSLTGDSGLRYWSSDAEETNAVSGLRSILPSKPGFVFIEEEDDTDVQESYTISASWSSSDDRLEMDTPSFSDTSKRTTKQMESDDDLKTGYDVWGTHTIYDSDEQGSFTLHYPNGQATAGAAFTGSNGGLSSSGGSGSVEVTTPTGFPDAARLDSDVSGTPSTNTILVGGPAVNTLVSDLAEAGKTWSGSDYSQGQALIQLVENAWNQNDALVVAGYSGSDTREAANFISNYADHQDRLSGKSKVTLSTGQ